MYLRYWVYKPPRGADQNLGLQEPPHWLPPIQKQPHELTPACFTNTTVHGIRRLQPERSSMMITAATKVTAIGRHKWSDVWCVSQDGINRDKNTLLHHYHIPHGHDIEKRLGRLCVRVHCNDRHGKIRAFCISPNIWKSTHHPQLSKSWRDSCSEIKLNQQKGRGFLGRVCFICALERLPRERKIAFLVVWLFYSWTG